MACDKDKMAEDEEVPVVPGVPAKDGEAPAHAPDEDDDPQEMEIFAVGTWNGKKWTTADLDAMVKAFEDTREKLKPYLKLGHDDGQKLLQKDGYPSAGWVTALKRVGDRLVASISGIPAKIKELIARKAYGRVSSEIYMNVDIEGKKYARALKAVALLGGDTPAVTSLDDAINLYGSGMQAVAFATDAPTETVVFTEDNMETEIYTTRIAELEGQVAEFTKRAESAEGERDELRAKVEQFTKDAEAREAEMFCAEVKACVDGALAGGKITPIEAEFYSKIASANRVQFDIVREHLDKRGKAEFASETQGEAVETPAGETEDDKIARVANEVVAEHAKTGTTVTYKRALMLAVERIKGGK